MTDHWTNGWPAKLTHDFQTSWRAQKPATTASTEAPVAA